MITMEFGVAIFPTHDAIRPGDVARLAEERGHESLFFPEHTHMPVEHSPYPGGEPLPYRYVHTFDLFVALTAAAAATSRLRVGSGVCLVIQRDPIITAKETASVDYLSGGRFEFGVGAGWNREEMANHGTDPRTRMAVMRERVEAIKAIWTTDEASYSGDHVNFDRIWSWPKPAQRPHPPVIVGGEGPTVFDRVLAFGDAWMPNHGPSDLIKRSAELRLRADRHISLQVMGVPADPAVFATYAAEGFDRVVHWLPSAGRGPVERAFDAADRADRLLMEAFMWRHHPQTARLLELVRGGAIGELRFIRGTFTFTLVDDEARLDPALAGGSLMDVGCYCVSGSRLLGGEPESVSAQAWFGPTGTDWLLTAMLRFPGDVLAKTGCFITLADNNEIVVARKGLTGFVHQLPTAYTLRLKDLREG